MIVELAEKVHLLFMTNYIDYSYYEFRDENQVEGYCWCYRDLFERLLTLCEEFKRINQYG